MLRITTRIMRGFSHQFKLPTTTNDLANTVGYINAPDQPTLTLAQKLSHFSPSSLYTGIDQFSRQFLFTLAHDYQFGLPAAVIIASLILRGIFFYPNVKGQIGALKMKELKPHMEKFKEKARLAQMTRNMALMKSAKDELKEAQKKRGVDNFYALLNVFQIPFVITWFLSLRYVTALPEVFPSVSQGFLWISDLSAYDPYFILPLASACFSSYAIILSPALKNAVVLPILEPFVKYMKYLPFLSLPITGFFPALLNIYWCTFAFSQTILMATMNTKWLQDKIQTSQENSKPQIVQAVFVQEKKKPLLNSSETPSSESLKNPEPLNVEKLQILTKKPKKPKKVKE